MFFGAKKSSSEDNKDWTDQITELIEGVIDGIRDKAVVPLQTIARALVYGFLAAIVGTATLVLLAVLISRIAIVYLGNAFDFASVVWLAYLIVGAIFVLAGMFLWSKRHAHTD